MKVVNTHHFGGVENLPASIEYIGRPSEYGNPYSSRSGKYSKEECVSLHRVDLYRKLVSEPCFFDKIKKDLCNKDLACWCKHDKSVQPCHGDTYAHILSPEFISRSYDRSILYYLLEDLRSILSKLKYAIKNTISQNMWIPIYFSLSEFILDMDMVFATYKSRKSNPELFCNYISRIVIDLELAELESTVNEKMMEFRINHATWVAHHFIDARQDNMYEPVSPRIKIKGKSK